ncbi:MAG: tRNA uridine-5-carboxymethylaminomethyl(34) synthesis GTPase MnmE [Clostridia bacterium]
MYKEDTIAAISTPFGTGGIGIVRISGDNAFDIAKNIFRGKTDFDKIRSNSIKYGKITDPKSKITIDEVLLSKMKAPDTYTREDLIEINCHGGSIVTGTILELVLRQGARLAEPGEFTKRAFLNGRIDLTKAEAVIDVINSKTKESTKAAIEQLEGSLSVKIKEIRQRIIGLLAHIEVTVDYPEHDIEEITGRMVYDELKKIKTELESLIKNFDKGRILRDGIKAVIAGRPNVGKSSLLNVLSGRETAIVTNIPGTTRDIVEEYINIRGIPVRLLDTAGIRKTDDTVEKIGVEKASTAMKDADLVIIITDVAEGLTKADIKLLETTKNKKVLVLINKIDLATDMQIEEMQRALTKYGVVAVSLKDSTNIEEIEENIISIILSDEISQNNEILVTNIRHKMLIDKALQSIEEACESHENRMPLDMITIDINAAAQHLGGITGENASEDVLNEIFSRFCIGK